MKKIISILVATIIVVSQMAVFALENNAVVNSVTFTTYEYLPITENRPYGFVSLRESVVSPVSRGDDDFALKVTGNYELDLIQNAEEKYGIWEFGFDFRTDDAQSTRLGLRMTSDTSNGKGVAIGTGKTELYVASNKDGKIGNLFYKVGATEDDWNTYKIIINYEDNTYVEYLNGEEAANGTIGNTYDYFKRIRIFGGFGENGGYLDNIILKKGWKFTDEVPAPGIAKLYKHLPIVDSSSYGFSSTRSSVLSKVDRGNGDLALKIDGNYELEVYTRTDVEKYGVWEFGFDFRTNDASKTKLGFRLTSEVTNGTAYGIAIGTLNDINYVATPVAGQTPGGKINGQIGDVEYKVGETEADWNTYKIRFDLENNTYTEYLNGVKACEGTIGNSYDYFRYIRLFGGFGEDGGYLDNVFLNEVSQKLSVNEIKYKIKNSVELAAENKTIIGTNLENITFTLNADVTVTEENAKIINESGEVVSGDVTTSGSDVIFTSFLTETLPGGYYKLVLDEDAVVGNSEIYSKFEKVFSVDNSRDVILAPTEGYVSDRNDVQLAAYIADADKVWFEINDENIYKFENVESNIYECTYVLSGNGVYYFDVFAEKNGEIVNINRTFAVGEYGKINLQTAGNLVEKGNETNATFRAPASKFIQAGRVVIEGDLTINTENTGFWFEIGANSNGKYSTDKADGYITLMDAPGQGTDNSILTADGKIYNTDKTYTVGEEMHIKFIVDLDKDVYEFYKDGIKIFEKAGAQELVQAKILYQKLRIRTSNGGTITLKNIEVYQEAEIPKVVDVLSGGVSTGNVDGNFVLPSTANEISVVFDKAYQTVTSDDVLVKCGENVIAPTTVTNDAETKILKIEGVTLEKNKPIEVVISENAFANVDTSVSDGVLGETAKATGKSLSIPIYVGDKQGLAVLPLVFKKDGNSALAYAKYVNIENEKTAYLLIADFTPENKISSVKFENVTFENGKGIIKTQKTIIGECRIMLWDKELSILADDVSER